MAQNKNQIKHNKLEAFLNSVQVDDIPGLILIFGEPYLVKQAFEILSLFLLGKDKNKFALENLQGGSVSMGDIIEQVSTYSFLVSKKIVAVKNIPLFQKDQTGSEPGFSQSDHDLLAGFINKGIPDNHFLLLTTFSVDKRKKIFKKIAEKGLIVDCQVASGARKADLDEQRTVLHSLAGRILSTSEKTMDTKAFNALIDLTGFDLDLFSRNLEKLIVFTGQRAAISINDVNTVIVRDKTDPIFNLTNAFMNKDVQNTLFYVTSLLNKGFHILQILKALENQTRKLILVKYFTKKFLKNNTINLKKINFNSFKQNVLPNIIEHDKITKTAIENQEAFLSKNKSTDLLIAQNPQNPYPVYQTVQKSENFSLNELLQALFFLSDFDYRLKSSSFDAKTAIENFIIKICSKGGFVYAQENKDCCHYF